MVYKKCCLLTGRLAARQMSPAICKTFIKARRQRDKKKNKLAKSAPKVNKVNGEQQTERETEGGRAKEEEPREVAKRCRRRRSS